MTRTKSGQGETPDPPAGKPLIESLEEVLVYFESEYQTNFLRENGLPVCPKCGTGYHGNGERLFCPNFLKTCPMVDENGNSK